MIIHALSYSNIWPFDNQIISIILHDGTYLIKAPIGSGKSFLFFDGLVYGLYGYTKRDVLNVQSTSWWVKVLFTNQDGDTYLIDRPLSGKKWTMLYRFTWTTWQLESLFDLLDVVSYNLDCMTLIPKEILEPIEFHRTNEIQTHIDLLLPPRQVFLQRNILMQDSENIFDLQPKQRIDILKLMFWLDMIDTIRDQVGDQKNQLRGQLKVLNDSHHIVDQYNEWYATFTSTKELFKTWKPFLSQEDYALLEPIQMFLEDPLSHNSDSLHSDITKRSIQPLYELWNHHRTTQTTLLHDQQRLAQEIADIKKECDTKQIDYNQNLHQLTLLWWEDSHISIHLLNQKLQTLLDEKNNKQALVAMIGQCEHYRQEWLIKKSELETRYAKRETLQTKIHWKQDQLQALQTEYDTIKQSMWESYIQSLHHEINSLNQSIQSLEQRKTTLESHAQGIQASIDQLASKSESHNKFRCTKFDIDCPFVDQITQWSLSKISEQVNRHNHELSLVTAQIVQVEHELITQGKHRLEKQSQIWTASPQTFDYSSPKVHELIKRIELLSLDGLTPSEQSEQSLIDGAIGSLEEQLNSMRNSYKELSDALVQRGVSDYQHYITTYEQLDTRISQLQHSIQDHVISSQRISQLKTTGDQLSYTIQDLQQRLSDKQWHLQLCSEKLVNPLYSQLSFFIEQTKQLDQLIHKVQSLYEEKKRVQQQALWINDQLQKATLLHTILGKELTLYVLDSYLPLLNEYINAFLAKVVSFQLRIDIWPDWDELSLTIQDERGSREVKSLSGGQKTILRLCWILATSVVFGNKILLLDETINNIDQTTVSRVTELLTDFVRHYKLKLYVVTHSEQIQAMSIWTHTIELIK